MAGDPARLRELQATLYDLITAPEGVAKRLEELGRAPASLEAIVKPSARLSPAARVDVYANMYFYRILDVLREEYAKVLAVLGETAFHNLVTDYLLACRPTHPSLREAGARLPHFLAGHALARERPWIPELARLERIHLELYDGPDAETLTLEDLRALPPDAVPALQLKAVPCHVVLRNRFDVSAAWTAIGEDEPHVAVAERAETLLVWREDVDVCHRVADPDEEPLLALLSRGTRFEMVCERLVEAVPEENVVARAFAILGRWVADGMLERRSTVA